MKDEWMVLKEFYKQFAKILVDIEEAETEYERTHTWEAHAAIEKLVNKRDRVAKRARERSGHVVNLLAKQERERREKTS